MRTYCLHAYLHVTLKLIISQMYVIACIKRFDDIIDLFCNIIYVDTIISNNNLNCQKDSSRLCLTTLVYLNFCLRLATAAARKIK